MNSVLDCFNLQIVVSFIPAVVLLLWASTYIKQNNENMVNKELKVDKNMLLFPRLLSFFVGLVCLMLLYARIFNSQYLFMSNWNWTVSFVFAMFIFWQSIKLAKFQLK